jgi:branched-chain amino acid transport system substrate-binding protein
VIVGTVIGLLADPIGRVFAERYAAAFGAASTPEVGCATYGSVHHYAIAAALLHKSPEGIHVVNPA